LLADGQPQSSSAGSVAVTVENEMELLCRNPRPVVLHRNPRHLAIGASQALSPHNDLPGLLGMMNRVGEEILEHFTYFYFVTDCQKALWGFGANRNTALCREDFQLRRCFLRLLCNIDKPRIQRQSCSISLPFFQKGLDETQNLLSLSDDGLGRGCLL